MSGNVPQDMRGELITAADGKQYFIIKKHRIKIKITEHFPDTGKELDEIITDLIINKMKEKAAK